MKFSDSVITGLLGTLGVILLKVEIKNCPFLIEFVINWIGVFSIYFAGFYAAKVSK